MASRDLTVRLLADPRNFQAGLMAAGKAMNVARREAYLMEKQQRETLQTMSDAGTSFVTFGTVATVGLGLAVKAAMDWETAWTGVLKTVDGTPAQLDKLESELRDLTSILPSTHTEIAAVAEAAGQLGIAVGDIADFTRVMIDMGQTTNMTSEEAATAMAQFMNVMGMTADSASELGSTIVALGNDGASTEKDIMDMALRIAAAGKQAGLSADEVLALSSATSSLGIQAEAGGSSISSVLMKISQAVSSGGKDLERFASVAGMTSQQFAKAWQTDAAGAFDSVIQGLGGMQKAGKDVFGVLQELGIQEILQRQAILGLASGSDVLTRALQTGNKAWEDNDALLKEALKRYETTSSQVAIARNRINDLGITMGEILLPIVADVLGFIAGLADAFNAMPEWLQTATVSIIGITAAAALLGGGLLMLIPKIAEFNAVIGGFSSRGGMLFTKVLRGAGNFMMGPWGIAIGAAITGLGIFAANQAQAAAEIMELTNSLDEQTGAITDNTKMMVAKSLQDAGAFEAAKEFGISLDTVTEAALGNKAAIDAVNAAIAEHSDELYETVLVEGNAVESKSRLGREADKLTEAIGEQSDSVDEAKAKHDELSEAMGKEKGQTVELSDSQRILAEDLGLSAEGAAELDSALSALDKTVQAIIDSSFQLGDAQSAYYEAIEDVNSALAENGSTLDLVSEAGRDNFDAITNLVQATAELAAATHEATGSEEEAIKVIDQTIDALEEQMRAAGASEEEIEEMTDALEEIKAIYQSRVTVAGVQEAIDRVEALNRELAKVNRGVGVNIAPIARPRPDGFADGGFVSGPGSSRSDSIPAWLSDGEFVVNARATAANRGLLEAINGGDNRFVEKMWKPSQSYTGNGFGGANINVTVPAWTDRFNMNQVLEDLQFRMMGG